MAMSIPGSPDLPAEVVALMNTLSSRASELGIRVNELEAKLAKLVEVTHETEQIAKTFSMSVIDPVQELTRNRDLAATLLKEIEQFRRSADSESGFAFNAKSNAEAHAKSIAEIKGTVEATYAGLSANRAAVDTMIEVISQARTSAVAEAMAVTEARTEATKARAKIEAAADRVAAVAPAIDQGAADAAAVTAAKPTVDAALALMRDQQAELATSVSGAAADRASLAKSDAEGKALVASLSETATTAAAATARVQQYENEIQDRQSQFEVMLAKLEGLLPHATSAGLASAFHNQKSRFSTPRPWWLSLFVGAVLALSVAALWGIPASSDTWDAILRHIVNRLPVVAPLVWLAIYAGHHHSMTLRMEEEYAFKEAVSIAFEGYKREMISIPAQEGSTQSPLVTLCENVLRALAERPGRIYEGGRADIVTPLSQVEAIVRSVTGNEAKSGTPKP